MSDTPKTDALREVVIGQYKEDELTGNGMGNILAALTDIGALECERDEARADLGFRRGLFQLQEQQLNEVRKERDKWKEKFIQQNKDLGCEMMDPAGTIWDHAKKLQDENKALREQYRLSSVCRELKEENERLKRLVTWPHDADPFTSPDHDNESRNYP